MADATPRDASSPDASRSQRSLVVYLPDLVSGGVPHLYKTLAPSFQRAGYDVTFLLDQKRGELVDTLPPGVHQQELGVKRQLTAAPTLARYLKRKRPDILLTAIEQMHVSTVAALALARVPTRHVVTQHNPLSVQARRPGLAFKALPRLYRHFLPHADAVVAVSRGVADDMEEHAALPRGTVRVIYNGLIDDSFEERANQPSPLPPAPNDAPTIVTVGRMAEQKDHATLIRAFALARHEPKPRLVMIGSGPLRPELEALARELGVADRILMPGFIANPLPVLRESDLFVLSSRYEGLVLVLIEALACGTPVLSTDCQFSPSEILEDGRHGILVPVGDAAAMARGIDQALAAPRASEQLKRRADFFSLESCARGYLDLFDELMAA